VKRKYGNRKEERIVNGKPWTFDSRKEARRYDQLMAMLRAGLIRDLVLQPEFVIASRVYDKAAGKYMGARKYVADFQYIEAGSGKKVVEDVKSAATRKDKTYRLKRHLFLERYGKDFDFREV